MAYYHADDFIDNEYKMSPIYPDKQLTWKSCKYKN